MNLWLWSATALIFCLVPIGVTCFRGDAMDRVVGLQMAGLLGTLILMLLAHGFHRYPFYDLALSLALLNFAGGLVFARFLERWL